MRCTLLVSALTGTAFAQYHVPTQGETIMPVTTTKDVDLATTTVLVTVTSVVNLSTTPASEFVPIPSTGLFPSLPHAPDAKTTFPVGPTYSGNETASASETTLPSNGTVIVTSTVSKTAESTVIVTSAQSHSWASHTTSTTASASTAGAGQFVKPGVLAMVAGVFAAFV